MAQIDDRGIIVTCPSCTAAQSRAVRSRGRRVPVQQSARSAATLLPATAEPVEVPSAEIFDALVEPRRLPVVVDFWAPWCGPCRMVAPELARVAAANAGRYLIVKVNTDAVPELGDRFVFDRFPTMAVFDGGRERSRTSGARPAADIEAFIAQAVARQER